jgi:predicted Zn-dependent protease
MLTTRIKPNKFLSVIGILIIGLLIANFLIPKPNIRKQIEDLRKKTAPSLDSFNNKLAAKNRFFDSVKYLISSGKLTAANEVIDQLLKQEPRNDYYLSLKGQVFNARYQYDSALYYYNSAIMINSNSGALIDKANTLVLTRHFIEAIDIYREAYNENFDFSYQLAQTFEQMKKKDSAIKYYEIYLQHYPDSLYQRLNQQDIPVYSPDVIRMKIKKLKN